MTRKKKACLHSRFLISLSKARSQARKRKTQDAGTEEKQEKVQDNRSAPGLGKNQSGLEQEEKNGREVSEWKSQMDKTMRSV